ncbi:MAG: two-component system, sensor histidine kinase YesM [Clostridiales bacterium]|nr:two-component system, sensor histidine kinase YesM [Clostridiales bacterium]MDK2934324.1 two-component system, sensor histidine kinase YesM [Clostridiales bacterium]
MIKLKYDKIKFRSIQSHIFLYFSTLIIITVLIIGIIFYYESSRTIEKNADEYAYQIVEQVSRNIEYYIGYMEDVSSLLYYNPSINNYLSQGQAEYKQQNVLENDLEEQKIAALLDSIMKMRKDIVSIFIFGKNGKIITNGNNFELKEYIDINELDWYKQASQKNGQPVVSSSHVQKFIKNQHPWVVSLSRQINDFRTKKSLGVLLIDLNYKVITDICSKINLGQKGYVFILNKEGNIVYHPQQQLIYTNLKSENIEKIISTESRSFIEKKDGKKRLVTIKTIPNIGWKIVGVSYLNDLLIAREDIRNSYIIVIFVCLLIATLISVRIASNISRPIKKLEALMKRAENGDFNVNNIDIKSSDEIEHLAATFKMMLQRIKALMQQIKEDQKAIRKSELKALQAQINPHFLYNALDAIVWMAESKKHDKVVLMTSALAKFFRLSLSKGDEIIYIKDEIEHIKYYLMIQKIRYSKKLEYEILVDPEILKYRIIKLVLQPLVENAIYHGIKNLPDGGKIEIKGKQVEGKILLQVVDNGVGIPSQKLQHILENENRSKVKAGGVGIKNVHERIQLYYGEDYGLTFESEEGQGTTVNVWLPAVI